MEKRGPKTYSILTSIEESYLYVGNGKSPMADAGAANTAHAHIF
jgi:hypothetical protein